MAASASSPVGRTSASCCPGCGAAALSSLIRLISAFAGGDYVRASRVLTENAADQSLAEAQRSEARRLLAAMKLDSQTLMVGAACVLLIVLVVAVLVLAVLALMS